MANEKLVGLTEDEAKSILMHYDGPGRAGLQPTEFEKAICHKMTSVIALFAADRILTPEEWEVIRDLRVRRDGGR